MIGQDRSSPPIVKFLLSVFSAALSRLDKSSQGEQKNHRIPNSSLDGLMKLFIEIEKREWFRYTYRQISNRLSYLLPPLYFSKLHSFFFILISTDSQNRSEAYNQHYCKKNDRKMHRNTQVCTGSESKSISPPFWKFKIAWERKLTFFIGNSIFISAWSC